MSRPILTVDSDREIVLEAPRGGAAVLGGLLALAALAVYLLLPGFRVAPGALAALALWAFGGLLRVHRLRLDLDQRIYTYRHGWRFAAPLRGGFAGAAHVVLARHQDVPGVEPSRLRSHRILLELEGLDDDEPFALGFPMGPRIAREKAQGYARRLGVALVDRTRTSRAGTPPPSA